MLVSLWYTRKYHREAFSLLLEFIVGKYFPACRNFCQPKNISIVYEHTWKSGNTWNTCELLWNIYLPTKKGPLLIEFRIVYRESNWRMIYIYWRTKILPYECFIKYFHCNFIAEFSGIWPGKICAQFCGQNNLGNNAGFLFVFYSNFIGFANDFRWIFRCFSFFCWCRFENLMWNDILLGMLQFIGNERSQQTHDLFYYLSGYSGLQHFHASKIEIKVSEIHSLLI